MKGTRGMWRYDFDNTPRHCWPTNDGRRILEGTLSSECHEQHAPRRAGKVEWMRFIHAISDHVTRECNPFVSDDDNRQLIRFVKAATTSDGRTAYAEEYLAKTGDPDVVARVFLANSEGWARIELYDDSLSAAADAALEDVAESYRQETVLA